MRVQAATGIILGVIAVAVASCSPGQTAFEKEAEKTINGDDGEKLPVDVKSADCETPDSTQAETTFPCTAYDDEGVAYTFTARITGSNAFEVIPG